MNTLIKRASAVMAVLMMCGCGSSGTPADTLTQTVTEASTAEGAAVSETEPAQTTLSETAAEEPLQTKAPETAAESESLTTTEKAVTDHMSLFRNKLTEIIATTEADYLPQYMFSLYDVGGDETPELLVSNGEFHAASVEVFSVIDGEVKSVGYEGSYSEALYMPSVRKFNGFYGGMGYFTNTLDTFDGKTINTEISVEMYEGPDMESSDYDNLIQEYRINGELVTKEEYEKARDENFAPSTIYLGRDHYLNENGISAVFDENDMDTAFDKVIMSVPDQESGWGDPYLNAYADIDGDGVHELFLRSDYNCRVYAYDGSIKYCGRMPSYEDMSGDSFDYSGYDLDWSYDYDTTQYRVYVGRKDGDLIWRETGLHDNIYTMTYENGRIKAKDVFHRYQLTDGTSIYVKNEKLTDSDEYDKLIAVLDSDEYIRPDFTPLAVG